MYSLYRNKITCIYNIYIYVPKQNKVMSHHTWAIQSPLKKLLPAKVRQRCPAHVGCTPGAPWCMKGDYDSICTLFFSTPGKSWDGNGRSLFFFGHLAHAASISFCTSKGAYVCSHSQFKEMSLNKQKNYTTMWASDKHTSINVEKDFGILSAAWRTSGSLAVISNSLSIPMLCSSCCLIWFSSSFTHLRDFLCSIFHNSTQSGLQMSQHVGCCINTEVANSWQ